MIVAADVTGRSVARVVTRLNVGGPARHVLILSRALPARGYMSDLIVGTAGPREGELTDPNVPFERLPSLQREVHIPRDAASFKWLLTRFRTGKPSIVHTHTAKAGALGRLAAVQAGVPRIVHTFHGHVLEGYFSDATSSLFIRMERWLARRTHALLAVSEAIRDQLFDLGIGREDQWHVVPLGLDLDDLVHANGDSAESRHALGLPSGGLVVAIVGRLVPIKDHALFFEAARRVATEFPDVTFLVAGDGELRDELERSAREVLGHKVHFVGWVSDLISLYAAADVVVLTSLNEGTPVALIEASAAGRPVVSTDVGGVSDVVIDGVTGFVVPPGDCAALAESLKRLLRDPELRIGFGRRGRQHVAARFSAVRLVDDITRLYDGLQESTPYDSSP